MDKKALVKKIVAQLEAELALYAQSARTAHEEATHEQSRAEHKYDTRGLEASYLAHGQSKQALEVELAKQQFETLPLRDFTANDGVDISAVVELELSEPGNPRSHYFIGPKAGGTEVRHANRTYLVITPQAPLGRALVGKKEGETFSLDLGRVKNTYRVVSVC